MFSLRLTRRFATFTIVAGLLAVAAPAGACSADLHSGPPGIVTDNKDPDKKASVHRDDALVFSGDVYDNEMGITTAGDAHDGASAILMADMGGQFSRTGPSANAIIAVLIGL